MVGESNFSSMETGVKPHAAIYGNDLIIGPNDGNGALRLVMVDQKHFQSYVAHIAAC